MIIGLTYHTLVTANRSIQRLTEHLSCGLLRTV